MLDRLPKHSSLLGYLMLLIGCICPVKNIQAQSNPCNKVFSLLTCSPGTELYSTFGHSALRVTDTASKEDWVFNWGTFDFSDPQFYSKFVRGKLLYYLNVEPFPSFMMAYQYEQRSVQEQVLALNCAEKTEMDRLLRLNLQPENRYYKYDFSYDNCTTRLRDLIAKATGGKYATPKIIETGSPSFRTLIYQYLDQNQQDWSKLGIDLLLGMPLDKKLTNHSAQFLPDYLLLALDRTKAKEREANDSLSNASTGQLVAVKQTLFQAHVTKPATTYFTPLVLFSLIALIVVPLSFIPNQKIRRLLNVVDFTWLFLTGALGILFVFMWCCTDHQACKDNLNIWWAYPPNIIVAFLLHKKWKSLHYHFIFLAISYAILWISWHFLPQTLNASLFPLVLMMAVRAWRRSQTTNPK
jgi:hypothetical protein